MAHPANHHFSRPAALTEDGQFKQFSVERQYNAVMPVTGRISGSHVVTVSDDDQLEDAIRAAGADLLGQQYGYARAGYVRGALRPSSQGAGRERHRP